MRNLPVPGTDALVKFDKIAGEKREPFSKRLSRLRNRIASAYAIYSGSTASLGTVAAAGINGVRAQALLHAYNSPTQTMRLLREELLDPGLEDFDECPYCGINDPKTLDHYLPKETFPEFSIFPSNLVPICHICNSHYKRTQFLSDRGDRLFLHSYFDVFPNEDFINVNVNVTDKVRLDFVSQNSAAHAAFSRLFQNHFDTLGLKERFLRKSSAEICRMRASLRRFHRSGGGGRVARELTQSAVDFRATLTGNHWKVALYGALARCDEFCDGGFEKTVELA